MKKYLFLTGVLCLLLSSCSYSVFYYADFQKYAKSGFTVSSLSDFTGRSYVAIGDLTLETNKDLTYQEMLDQMVDKAKKIGANGLIGYDAKRYVTRYSSFRVASGVAVVFDKPLSAVPEKIQKGIRYDLAKALEDAKYKRIYLVVENGAVVKEVYDPDTEKYLTFRQFVSKYGAETLSEIYKYLEEESKNPNHL